jgi:hypothetical protein
MVASVWTIRRGRQTSRDPACPAPSKRPYDAFDSTHLGACALGSRNETTVNAHGVDDARSERGTRDNGRKERRCNSLGSPFCGPSPKRLVGCIVLSKAKGLVDGRPQVADIAFNYSVLLHRALFPIGRTLQGRGPKSGLRVCQLSWMRQTTRDRVEGSDEAAQSGRPGWLPGRRFRKWPKGNFLIPSSGAKSINNIHFGGSKIGEL